MIRGWGAGALVGIVVVVSAACSSSNHDDDDFDDPGALPDAGPSSTGSVDFIAAYCAAMESCCTALALPAGDASACKARLDYGQFGHDSAAETACLAAIAKASKADASWCTKQSRDDAEVCSLAFFAIQQGEPKRAALGDACAGSLTFSSSFSSEPDSHGAVCYEGDGIACRIVGGAPPVCVALAKVGEPCDDNATEPKNCVYDAYCTSAGTCRAYAEFGESCGPDALCDDRYACTNGTCGNAKPAGATCNDNLECESSVCRAQTADASVSQCDPGVSPWGLAGPFCANNGL